MNLSELIFSNLSRYDYLIIILLLVLKAVQIIIDKRSGLSRMISTETDISKKIKLADILINSINFWLYLLISIIYYLLVKFFVFPFSDIYGYVLTTLLIITNSRGIIFFLINPKEIGSAKYFIRTAIIARLFSVLYGFMIFSILLFSFINNLHFSDIYKLERDLNNEVTTLNNQNDEIELNIYSLNNDLDKIETILRNTKASSEQLRNSIKLINERRVLLNNQKEQLEYAIIELETKTENEIKSETSYKIISKLLSKPTFAGIIIGIFTSILGSFLYNTFLKRKINTNDKNDSG